MYTSVDVIKSVFFKWKLKTILYSFFREVKNKFNFLLYYRIFHKDAESAKIIMD